MCRWTTPLIVAAVVLVAVLAAADALRGNGESEPKAAVPESPTITRASPPTLRDVLRREAITGFVVYTDRDCVLHSLLLPRMLDEVVRTDADQPFRMCRFSSGGGRYLPEGQLASPGGRLIAECRGGHIAVWELQSGIPKRSLRGCPPAWRPDRRLTYARGDRIMEGRRILFSAADLKAAARLQPNIHDLSGDLRIFVHATDLAWLDETHLVTTLEIRVPNLFDGSLAVLFSGKEVTAVAGNRGSGPGNWVVSPAGNFAASENGIIVRRDGGSVDPPQNLPAGRAVAFSPDEQWLAYVTSASVYLIRTPGNGEPGRIIRLPLEAQDLVWEPAGVGSGDTTTAPG
jgi:hypothetical protein